MIAIKDAHFLTSSSQLFQCPASLTSEIVILGRSNVGKSSFINTLLGKNLAKSSATPGKTRLANFFSTTWEDKENALTTTFNVIDLPGFGYAKVSKSLKKEWEGFLWELLSVRTSIKLFIHLVDARHLDLEIDKNAKENIQALLRPDQAYLSLFTKFDKLNKNEQHRLFLNAPKPFLINTTHFNALSSKYPTLEIVRQTLLKYLLTNPL
ncbi:ribosome biogenesis GTP-binding protein YihA/YsxC [Helicobacter pylori]|uniref:ribosome biogenesis GTP-binding protein YihA/YsxC n=1 Tax=Helicobacter pylori TaxID=210 RepID=UPI00025ACB81|nr:ribosome biogenesis GTP-binding protein YihA/YsxC [Helicobacter pylori]EIE28259.1 GTP-binding protein YsxC [Helicobacter pylori NCTC 11637 = CCUG 17874 = ATCC 43504 = JCM 12093]MBM0601954.1 YihA family ribosome biogenesis GTP-binding protein [Helicobacter pylori]MBM0609262.1 YihA family ribosome biogenesis GTP-binding protein [Helicobacter pylori]MBM0618437.1 YihA family ribosome biogenesis GTP-binding protein [Helicobacter pylori]MBM0625807.1 YihA family ribosome biogenesis GTP-binding pro